LKKLRFMAVALLLAILCTPVEAQRTNRMATELDYVYAGQVIVTVVDSYSRKTTEIPALRKRMDSFISILNRVGGIDAYIDTNEQFKNVLMGWSQEAQGNKVGFFVVVPNMMGLQRSKSKVEFEDYIAASIAHEVIHWELSESKKFPLNEMNRIPSQQEKHAEAVAWGITILEIIRPMMKQGRMNDVDMRTRSLQLATFKDDYNHPLWIGSFSNYGK